MGSSITLGLDALDLDWGQNDRFFPHEQLFRPGDLSRAKYYYADDIVEEKEAYVRPLRSVAKRLDLLGYTATEARIKLSEAMAEEEGLQLEVADVCKAIAEADVDVAAKLVGETIHVLGAGTSAPAAELLLRASAEFQNDAALDLYARDFLETVDPYVLLSLLATNPRNLDRAVIWRFADVVEAGYADPAEFVPSDDHLFVIITEGSSDSAIIKKALQELAADVADFFGFLDMKDNYPFAGTGNLVNFCKGLVKLPPAQTLIVVFDNDEAGCFACEKVKALDLPSSIRPIKLPDLPEFESFNTVGPTGTRRANINGVGAAIECYLDLDQGSDGTAPVIRWRSYAEKSNRSHGVLENKEAYSKRFFEMRVPPDDYNWTKLQAVVDLIVETCTRASS